MCSSWRFKNFNIDHRELESCRDAHRELQERIESLEDGIVAGLVDGIISALPTEKATSQIQPQEVASSRYWMPWRGGPPFTSSETKADSTRLLCTRWLLIVMVAVPAAAYAVRRFR